jgi:hypothetical protein
LFFETKSSGRFSETDYWWSHKGSATLDSLSSGGTLTAMLGDPTDWSDFYGHFGSDPNCAAAFQGSFTLSSFSIN